MTTTAKKTTTKKDPLELPLKPFAFEVFHLISKQRSKAKKVEVLKRYEDPSLKALLIWNFDEKAFIEEFGYDTTFPQVVCDGKKLGGTVETVKFLREQKIITV